jgi:hypothetical protein
VRQLIAAIKPFKPIDQMSDGERRRFVEQVVTQIAAKAKQGR